MIKILPNGLHVLIGDTHLSKWTEENGSLINRNDAAMNHNIGCIKPGFVVVDGGAALGDHTQAYLDAVGPTGVVYAFEPNPAYFDCLSHNCPKAICINAGLWSESAKRWMEVPEEGNIGASALSKTGKLSVVCITLDSLNLPACDFIKLDIEGAELEALRGAQRTIEAHKPIIQCEVNPPLMATMGYDQREMERWLHDFGYSTATFGVPSEFGAIELIAWPLKGNGQ